MTVVLRAAALILLLVLSGCAADSPPAPVSPPAPLSTPTFGLGETTPIFAPPSLDSFPPPTATPVFEVMHGAVLEGLYASSFEYSAFVPCDRAGTVGPQRFENTAWLGATAESGFYDQWMAINGGQPYSSSHGYVYVRIIADVWPERDRRTGQGYGHLSAFSSQVMVTEVITMSLENRCPA